ncbi:EVE domain-containing protein [Synechococcus sp. HK01-R]|uniref:EVE domain-containing protein n=1 Tax=Synechococcus sp. HK01-R TaxID=2751171 RepID=UPI001627E229|nr:EVE domain-containing protein [Synechococcus sp. HK01-R]QNG28181.1 EVE domain-containing protein [Synechococcus sp. HK01-R]
MKSEPDVYGIQDLARERETLWDGIRNYQARNFMRSMNIGDQAFFYHSNCKPPGIVGLMEVVETGLTDPTQFDPSSKYYDPASKQESPRWDCVRLRYVGVFAELLSLDALRETYNEEQLTVVRRGNRLSILPVADPIATDLLSRLGTLH